MSGDVKAFQVLEAVWLEVFDRVSKGAWISVLIQAVWVTLVVERSNLHHISCDFNFPCLRFLFQLIFVDIIPEHRQLLLRLIGHGPGILVKLERPKPLDIELLSLHFLMMC